METKGYEDVTMMEIEEGCSTPKRDECQIPVRMVPPPPPRKKRSCGVDKRKPPENGYFQGPEVELFFAMQPKCQGTFA
ncbi:hypothetical protein CQW23_15901 [Capsicum baccatum]|uniref:Cyclin-dependent protein kinase inhibitor SMR4 n=2 Tax=Capsicum TaxID=4071 RepID=A0A2G2ZDZ9_CAPAN|nr:cyclin-dependent protein kinase inhibitor SMR4-like [Capsicum annuum]PHT46743.1 hypothetical protein CQW23_15901 [Capsicum baccatum]PHU16106.1 hypothetical protein BC332_17311 [Capsicum chinense]KAF3626862.1 putative WRKY DNA-binding protein 49 [Capsicum annuum]KAF3628787.1 putative WRKY DNA-binding protein 49 [Capsicum annuum]PHT80220.1 hypothetical protein T459_18272 [Capsicum annuum]